jgi:hypothetical protein
MVYVIMAWFIVGSGTLLAADRLIKLGRTWAKPEMTRPGARSKAWSDITLALTFPFLGWIVLAELPKGNAPIWVRVVDGALVTLSLYLLLRSELRGGRHSRRARAG